MKKKMRERGRENAFPPLMMGTRFIRGKIQRGRKKKKIRGEGENVI